MGAMEPEPSTPDVSRFRLRDYQNDALDALGTRWRSGERRGWLVLPPGAGKTLVGLTAAGRLDRRTVVFAPNTAIQGQWITQARALGHSAGTDRDLGNDVTVLTYQTLAVFDPDVETDEEGHDRQPGRSRRAGKQLLGRLHDNGRNLVERMRRADPLTLVLDECHHLLDVWGRLLSAVLDELTDEYVIGLTGTPPTSLTRSEAALVADLFGEPISGASVPALVRRGHLAPFAELAWLCEPDRNESEYIDGEAERFAELVTDLMSTGFASTDFLPWLDSRFTADAWPQLLRQEPRLVDAALRFRHAGLLSLPSIARPAERHRRAPAAEDWIEVLSDYVQGCLLPNDDGAALETVRKALPAIGYTLTRKGIRRGSSPVDRVLARSAAKTGAAVEIATLEGDELGDRLRCLILCDHERASATLPARLHGVLSTQAGSARLMLERLIADPRTSELAPMLVTGNTVAAAEPTARAFADWAIERGLAPAGLEPRRDGDFATLEGTWTSRRWVPAVTEFFAQGHSRVLIGTRALLGEGWDAPAVNVLIDATTATTPTAVVQVRGRVMRLDPDWPEKVAHTWSLVCATDQHPKGAADWDRFVRKHDGYLAPGPTGEIMAGVGHVHPELSPYAPPKSTEFDMLNAAMLQRARDRENTREAWQLGSDFRDRLVHTIRVRADRTATTSTERPDSPLPPPSTPDLVPARARAHPIPEIPRTPWPSLLLGAGSAVGGTLGASLADHFALLPFGIAGLVVLASGGRTVLRRRASIRRYATMLEELAHSPVVPRLAYAVADALRETGHSTRGADGVRLIPEPDGAHRLSLVGDSTEASERFVTALDDVLAPPAAPPYLIPRYLLTPGRVDDAMVLDWLAGNARADAVAWHAVPDVFGNQSARRAFTRAWNSWVSEGEPLSTRAPEGAGLLAAHGGSSPLDVSTASRIAWE